MGRTSTTDNESIQKTANANERLVVSAKQTGYQNKWLIFLAVLAISIAVWPYLSKSLDKRSRSDLQLNADLVVFQKKQECAKFIPQIKKEFEEKNSGFGFTKDYKLEEVFYSSKLDTCLKAYSLIGGLTESVVVYVIDDLFTNKNIFQKSTGELTDLDIFNNKIKELKD
ncbi:MAG: hypothetical protein AAB593_00230 [Patescibacteria group bacterium]